MATRLLGRRAGAEYVTGTQLGRLSDSMQRGPETE